MPTASDNLTTTAQPITGGVDAVPAVGPTKKILISGTWDIDDIVSLVFRVSETQYDLMNGPMLGKVPVHAMTYANKVYLSVDDRVYFSGVQLPTGWENRFPGFGFIAASGQRGEAVSVVATSVYGKKLVVLSRNNIQLWDIDPKPAQNTLIQTLDNTGTIAANSVVSYGELDLFYLADSGVRSLRSRELLDLVNVHDVGTPIDNTIQGVLAGLTDAQKRQCFGLYNPVDGRYWIWLVDRFYVFSYFPGSKISAWSVLDDVADTDLLGPSEFTFSEGCVFNGKFILKGMDPKEGTTLILQTQHTTYAAGEPTTAVIPFIDAKSPFSRKIWHSVDVIGTGTWQVLAGNNPADITALTEIYPELTLSTPEQGRIPLNMHGTHLVLKFVCVNENEATIAAASAHYDIVEVKR